MTMKCGTWAHSRCSAKWVLPSARSSKYRRRADLPAGLLNSRLTLGRHRFGLCRSAYLRGFSDKCAAFHVRVSHPWIQPSRDGKRHVRPGLGASGAEGRLCLLSHGIFQEGLEPLLGGLEPMPSRQGTAVKFRGSQKLQVGFHLPWGRAPLTPHLPSTDQSVIPGCKKSSSATTSSLSALRGGRAGLS